MWGVCVLVDPRPPSIIQAAENEGDEGGITLVIPFFEHYNVQNSVTVTEASPYFGRLFSREEQIRY